MMSIIPPLSIWSSIKIRPPQYYSRGSNEAKSSVSYADSWSRIKRIQKNSLNPVQEVVNLRVPSPLQEESSVPDVIAVSPEIHRKRASRFKRTQNIGHVTVPNIPALYTGRNNDRREGRANHRHKPCWSPSRKESYEEELARNLYFDEKFQDCDSDDGMESNCIPTVKPWTPEELRTLSKRYNLMEEKANPTAEKKKIKRKVKAARSEQKTPKKQTRSFCSDVQKSRKSPCSNCFCNDFDSRDPQNSLPVAKWKPTGRIYYETKLAELYMIELGVKQ